MCRVVELTFDTVSDMDSSLNDLSRGYCGTLMTSANLCFRSLDRSDRAGQTLIVLCQFASNVCYIQYARFNERKIDNRDSWKYHRFVAHGPL